MTGNELANAIVAEAKAPKRKKREGLLVRVYKNVMDKLKRKSNSV